jgi:hypothetical protein
MVTADQGGHLAYLFKANTCLDNSVTTFLATGERPQQDIACAAEPAAETTTPAGGSRGGLDVGDGKGER